MTFTEIFGIVMIALGAVLVVLDFLAYAKKKLTDGLGLIWLVFAALLGGAGIAFLVAKQALFMVLLILMVVLVLFLFGISQVVSELVMKNRELAMQVSLLNQENESILQELEQMKETGQDE